MRTFATIFAVVMNLALGDAILKEIAAARWRGSVVPVVDGLFSLAYVENRGCAWGMLQGQVWPLAAFGALALAILVWKRKAIFTVGNANISPRLGRFIAGVAECLLYAGIFGNMLDRIFRGYVIDMFDFHWGIHHFPCFNLADAYISVAAAILIVIGFLPQRGAPKAANTIQKEK